MLGCTAFQECGLWKQRDGVGQEGHTGTTAHRTQHCKHGTRSAPTQTQSSAATSLPQLLPSSGRQSTNTQPSLSLGALRRKKPIIAFLHPAEELNSTDTEMSQPSGRSPPSAAGTRADFLGVLISSGLSFPRCSLTGSSGPAHPCPVPTQSSINAKVCRMETLTWSFFPLHTKTRADESQINLKKLKAAVLALIFLHHFRLKKNK